MRKMLVTLSDIGHNFRAPTDSAHFTVRSRCLAQNVDISVCFLKKKKFFMDITTAKLSAAIVRILKKSRGPFTM